MARPSSGMNGGGHLLHNLMLFGRLLRELGLDVHSGRMIDAAGALRLVGVRRRSDFYHALRTVLVHRQQDLALFDEAFQTFWRPPKDDWTTMDLLSLGEERRYRQPQFDPPPSASDPLGREEGGDAGDSVEMTRTYSAREVLREKDFAEFNADEIYEARALIAELRWDLGKRRTRRWTPGEGPLIDLRRAVRKNMAVGGELVELPRRQRKEKRRPLVLICDVSGSMERYTRILLHFIHTVFGDASRIEAFLFATRLTRVTSYLTDRDVDRAVTEVSHAVPDWAGGTRTGDVLKAFNFQWARRVLGWGGVVLVISDGWDRGEPEVLRSEMARLQRSCHRLVWLNPLLGSPSYEPLSRGMQSALPFVDDFLPVHNLASLEGLAEHLNGLSPRRPGRRQQTWHLERRAAEEPEPQEAPQRSWRMDANPTFRHPRWGKGETQQQG